MVSLRSHLARAGGHRPGCGHLITGLVALALMTGVWSGQASDDPVLSSWMKAHAQLQTWSADLVQTRHLAALAQPLISTGRVYFSQPGLFRWELGHPPETIAIRATNALWLVYPPLQRAERYPLEPGNPGALRDVLTLMEAGFPKDEASWRKQYEVATRQESDGLITVILKPRSDSARRLVTQVSLTFQTGQFTLAASEIEFADGSRLQNQFSHSRSNEPLPKDTFSTQLPPEFKIVEPFKP